MENQNTFVENNKTFSELLKLKPYQIGKVSFMQTNITLDGINVCSVPSNIANSIVDILNGAYCEGVMKTSSAFKVLDIEPSV